MEKTFQELPMVGANENLTDYQHIVTSGEKDARISFSRVQSELRGLKGDKGDKGEPGNTVFGLEFGTRITFDPNLDITQTAIFNIFKTRSGLSVLNGYFVAFFKSVDSVASKVGLIRYTLTNGSNTLTVSDNSIVMFRYINDVLMSVELLQDSNSVNSRIDELYTRVDDVIPLWAANTNYKSGKIVRHSDNKIYLVTQNHQTATFSPANFQPLSVESETSVPPLTTFGLEFGTRITFDPNSDITQTAIFNIFKTRSGLSVLNGYFVAFLKSVDLVPSKVGLIRYTLTNGSNTITVSDNSIVMFRYINDVLMSVELLQDSNSVNSRIDELYTRVDDVIPLWAANTNYKSGKIVRHSDNKIYLVTQNHQTATFSPANFQALSVESETSVPPTISTTFNIIKTIPFSASTPTKVEYVDSLFRGEMPNGILSPGYYLAVFHNNDYYAETYMRYEVSNFPDGKPFWDIFHGSMFALQYFRNPTTGAVTLGGIHPLTDNQITQQIRASEAERTRRIVLNSLPNSASTRLFIEFSLQGSFITVPSDGIRQTKTVFLYPNSEQIKVDYNSQEKTIEIGTPDTGVVLKSVRIDATDDIADSLGDLKVRVSGSAARFTTDGVGSATPEPNFLTPRFMSRVVPMPTESDANNFVDGKVPVATWYDANSVTYKFFGVNMASDFSLFLK